MIFGNREFIAFQTYLHILGEPIRIIVSISSYEAIPYTRYRKEVWTYVLNLNREGQEDLAYQLSIGCELIAMDLTTGMDDFLTKTRELSTYLYLRAAHELLIDLPENQKTSTLPPVPLFCIE